MNVAQRRTSVHSSNARSGGSATSVKSCARPTPDSVPAVDLVDDLLDRGGDRREKGPAVAQEPFELGLALVRERVVAPAAPLGVLPPPLHEAPRLEVAQQRVHRVRVDAQHALGDRGDSLHELVAVGGPVVDEVEDEQRQHLALAELAGEGVATEAACTAT